VQAVIQLWFLPWFGFEAPDQAINDDFGSAKKSAQGIFGHRVAPTWWTWLQVSNVVVPAFLKKIPWIRMILKFHTHTHIYIYLVFLIIIIVIVIIIITLL